MEKAILILDTLNITQKMYGTFSHKGSKAIDIAGDGNSILNLYAPFTGTIKKIYPSSNSVWLESNDKVIYSDGTIDYMTILATHDNDVSDLYVGKVIKQGQLYYTEGIRGYATGNHIEICIGKGKFEGSGWYKNSYGTWCINNQYDINKGLFLSSNTNVINDAGYNFIRSDNVNSSVENINKYVVKSGDTLTKISNMFNTTVDELVRLNNINNPDLIYVDQVLEIPSINNYFNIYSGSTVSIVDALKSIGENSSFEYRSMIAKVNNIENYTGSSNQNTYMLELLKLGKLIKP